jgi:hypothetical protein
MMPKRQLSGPAPERHEGDPENRISPAAWIYRIEASDFRSRSSIYLKNSAQISFILQTL